jgi:hypothetical protein
MNTDNCALGPDCRCVGEPDYFNCTNWGRSTLAAPALTHTEQHYTGQSKKDVIRKLDERKRKMDNWTKRTDERLGNERAANQVKSLQKRGIKI